MPDLLTILRDWASLNLVAPVLWVMYVEITRLRRKARQR